jgi:Phage Tail Collar Domain
MADPINYRDVAKKRISKSFRGLLRVSPDDEGADVGMTEAPVPVYDSVGNMSALSVGTESIFVEKETVSKSQLRDRIIFGSNSNVPVTPPGFEDILIGDKKENYIQYNLRQFLDEYFATNVILEQLVPVGTILYIALGAADLNRLPAKYKGWYDFCLGQSTNSQNGLTYNGTNYPDLCKVIRGSSAGTFTLPDLRNKFIRSYSPDATRVSADGIDGWVNAAAHNVPLKIEYMQTNGYPSRVSIGSCNIRLFCSAYQHCSGNVNAIKSHCNMPNNILSYDWWIKGRGHRKYNGDSWYIRYIINFYGIVSSSNLTARESRPYNMTLVPIIKIK